MLCDICHKNEATIHIQEIVDNHKQTLHLCSSCAASKPQLGNFNFGPFNLAEMLYKLSGAPPEHHDGESESTSESAAANATPRLVCAACGWNEDKLRRTGKLGCAHCYDVFAPMLAEALPNMHRGTTHLGKHPKVESPGLEKQHCEATELNLLQEELQKAIAEEAYEQAATLRDRINDLKLHQAEDGASPDTLQPGGAPRA